MAARRTYRQRWPLAPAAGLAITAQAGALLAFAATREAPPVVLTIERTGKGVGTVLTSGGGPTPMVCDDDLCYVAVPRGTTLSLTAMPSESSTFDGWDQAPARTLPALRSVLGDPLATCVPPDDPLSLAAAGAARDYRICTFALTASTKLTVDFGLVPEAVALTWDQADLPPNPEAPPAPKPKEVIEAEKLEEAAEVALLDPPPPPELVLPPPVIPPPQPPPPPPAEAPKPVQPPPSNMRMVEVPDENEVKEAPDDATHLSDKNRDVAEELAATETNLEKELKGEQPASVESPDTTSAEIGGPEVAIAQLEVSEATTSDRLEASERSGQDQEAMGLITGETGTDGEDGQGEATGPGALSMRGIGGRGSLVEGKLGDGKREGKRGIPGVNSPLAFEDYQRLMGKEAVDKESELARRRLSAQKGRWERKLEVIKSSLENFTPDIRHGNQTALKTRAHPFAVYLARMHRRIHELWGFGYLESLDRKGSDHPLNDFDLWVNIEVAVNPDGTVHKTTIAKTSGKLEFDVAALDTVLSSAPFEETPEAIRSVDGRVYLRWGFYRNWRQCGTFNAEPYILTEIPGGAEPIDDGAALTRPKRGNTPVTPEAGSSGAVSPSTSVTDPQAVYAANMWVSGLATANIDKLVAQSTVPFRAAGAVAAANTGDLKDLYLGLVAESGRLRDWKLLTGDEYAKRAGAAPELASGALLLWIRTDKASFALVLTRVGSGEYRASQLLR